MINEVKEKDIIECVNLIKESFKTVADELRFTEENAPGFTAFSMTEDKLKKQLLEEKRTMYAYYDEENIVGYYSILLQQNNECELNNLCVSPAYRHKGVGEELLHNAFKVAKKLDCVKMNIGIVEENVRLRKWYESFGFIHTGTQKFDFFPFTCGYMEKEILEKSHISSEKVCIQAERLTLVPHGTKYLDTTHEYASDIENTKYMMALPSDSLEATREFLESCEREWEKEKPEFYELAIIKDGIQIGSIGLYLNENCDTCELGWILARDYHGYGYATEAALAAMKYASEEIGIQHFIAHCDSENSASENVMKKLGMTKVSCYGGRKNKGSYEERMECLYEMFFE